MEEQTLWTFDRFEPGQLFGTIDVAMDAKKRADWVSIYGKTDSDLLPRGMVVAAMMESYVRAIQPRPSGNVHASQVLNFSDVRPRWGTTLSTMVSCTAKAEKNGRFWVDFGILVSADASEVLSGTIRSIWAK
ncbi:MAG: hypothetical protein P1V13_20660 [Rhizobiaceae bacterium]|nr:hypothetical protein [Rhizobiaceae bacterium]